MRNQNGFFKITGQEEDWIELVADEAL